VNNTKPKQIFAYIRDSVELRLQLVPWERDQAFGGHEKIYYAVDTDVVKLFSEPEKKLKYATVFNGDSTQTQKILAWALGRFIFYRLTNNRPLLVIPPHHQEMDRVFGAIALHAASEIKMVSEIWPKLEKYLQDYKRSNDIDALVRSLEKHPLDLIRFVCGGGEGYAAELSRITELLEHGRLLHIERYLEHPDREPWTIPILRIETNRKHYDILKELSKSWSIKLFETKSQKTPRSRITDDAEVLARLEWINREMEEEGKRLVLITGDHAIHKAAKYDYDNNNTFADLFIRHPKVFLAAPDFLTAARKEEWKTDSERELGLTGWLDVFLARYEPGHVDFDRRLIEIFDLNQQEENELAYQFIEKIPNGISRLNKDWNEFVRLAGVEYGLGSGRDALNSFVKVITKDGLTLARNKIEKQATEILQKFWQVATVAGYWSMSAFESRPGGVLDPEQILPLRGVPTLRFTLEPQRSHLKKLWHTLSYEDIIDNKIAFDDLNKQDPSGYSGFLLYALALGAAGRWSVVINLSKLCLIIADQNPEFHKLPEGYEPITGNEAAYCLAWAIRHGAKTTTQLGTARSYLNEAISRREKAIGHDEVDIRYESESIALDMTYNLYRIFLSKTSPGEDIPSLAECQERALKLLSRIEKEDEGEEEHIRIAVEKQTLAYLFCALILREFKEMETIMDHDRQKILKWLPRFEAILGCSKKYRGVATCFTQPIFLVACCLYRRNEKSKKYTENAKLTLNSEKVQRCYMMPYDKEFYSFLLRLVIDRHAP